MSKYRENPQAFAEGQAATERPDIVTKDHLEFLDELRESGVTNMFGARPYLMQEFDDLTEAEASKVVGYWMKSFGNPNR